MLAMLRPSWRTDALTIALVRTTLQADNEEGQGLCRVDSGRAGARRVNAPAVRAGLRSNPPPAATDCQPFVSQALSHKASRLEGIMDFDPRDYDSRDDDRSALDRHHRGMSHSYDELDRDGHLRLPDTRDRNDDARDLGRGPGDSRQSNDKHGHDLRDEERWPDRDRDHDPRDVFTRDLDLPRGRERAIVHDRDREYTLRGSESRTLATVGAFRVVSSRELRDHDDRPTDPRSGDLRHLREQELIETTRVPGSRDYAVSLTKEGRSLLESHRDGDREGGQTFYAGVKRERELEHDVQVYRAFEREAERLEERSARIDSRRPGLRAQA